MDARPPDPVPFPADDAVATARAPETPVEHTLRDYTQRLERLKQVGLAVVSADAPATAINIAVNYIEEVVDCLSAGVSLYDPAGPSMTVLQSSDDLWPPGATVPVTLPEALVTLAAGELWYLADLRAVAGDSPGLQAAWAAGGRSLLAAPVRAWGTLLGLLWIIAADVRPFTADEQTIAREMADLVAVALYNRRVLEAEQKARERERVLREVAASLTLDLDRDEVLQRILEHLGRLIPYLSASIILLDGQQIAFAVTRDLGVGSEQLEGVRRRMPPVIQLVLGTCQLHVIEDTMMDAEWVAWPGFEYIRAWLGVPLMVKGACIGVLTIDRDQPRSFSATEVELATTFGNQAAIAIENARLFHETQAHAERLEARVRERTRELEALYGVTASAIARPELDNVLARALELAVGAFACPAGTIHLAQPGGPLQLAAQRAREEDALLGALHEPTVAALLARQAAATETWIADALLNAPGAAWVRAFAVVPLRAHGRNLGLLSLWSETAGAFAGSSRFLTAMADQLAAVVENVQLRQMTRQAAILEERERMARELHDAVTQTVYSAGLFAEAARESARAGDLSAVEYHSQAVVQRVYQALGEMRLLLFELRSDTLAQRGLAGALRERLRAVEERAGVTTQLRVKDAGDLPPALEETVYWVALEALNNALHHSHATHVDVTLRVRDNDLILVVRDDGQGFRRRDVAHGGGMGLHNMKQRLQKVGGTLHIVSRLGNGTRVEARAPLTPPPRDNSP